MSGTEVYAGGIMRQRWDDASRTYTEWDSGGNVSLTRAYGNQENTDADLRAVLATLSMNESTLRDRASIALAGNAAYLGIGAPTNAQVVAQVAALTRQSSALIRLLLRAFDSTN